MAGVTAAEYRRRHELGEAVAEFTARLVSPFAATFRTFHPLQPP